MHSAPGSPQTYCLTLPKFIISLSSVNNFSLSHFNQWQHYHSLLFLCVSTTHRAPGMSQLGPPACFIKHIKKLKRKMVRNKGQKRSYYYFFSGTWEISVRLGACRLFIQFLRRLISPALYSTPLILFSFLLSLHKDWQLYIILLLSAKWIVFHNGLRWHQNRGN